jgi:hypothetical protein
MKVVKDATYYRNRRAKLRNQTATVQPSATENATVAPPDATIFDTINLVLVQLTSRGNALHMRCDSLEERLDKLGKVQRPLVVRGQDISRTTKPVAASKEVQASGKRMVDNSPMGRMYRG